MSPSRSRRSGSGVTFDTVRQIAGALPGVEEGTSYGTPALRVRGKFFVRLREDGESLVVKVGHDERDMLLAADPKVFFITDHYVGYPAVLVRLSVIDADLLRSVLEDAWRRVAPQRLVTAHDTQQRPQRRRGKA